MSLRKQYTSFNVGQSFPDQIGTPDRNLFDFANDGTILFMTLNKPTLAEIRQIRSGEKRFRMTCFPGVLWMTFKFGTLDWAEAPFSPHLCKQADLPRNLSFASTDVHIVLVDSSDGEVKYYERLEYNDAFTAALRTGVILLLGEEFSPEEYDMTLDAVQAIYSAEQIAQKAVVECVFEKRLYGSIRGRNK